eukprot:scaffold647949_cov40-Prasinocladus_malaysianus.AAC.2
MGSSVALVLTYVLLVVVRVAPWWNAQRGLTCPFQPARVPDLPARRGGDHAIAGRHPLGGHQVARPPRHHHRHDPRAEPDECGWHREHPRDDDGTDPGRSSSHAGLP